MELLYTLFVKSRICGVITKDTVKKNLGHPENFKLLVETAYSVHSKFCDYSEYRLLIPDIHSKLLAVVNAVCTPKKCRYITVVPDTRTYPTFSGREILQHVDENAVFFIGQLTTAHHKTKALMIQLANVLKIICYES